MILEFICGWISAIIFLWLLLNKFDSNGTFSTVFFDRKALENFSSSETSPYQESFDELEEVIKKSGALLKELQQSHFQPKQTQRLSSVEEPDLKIIKQKEDNLSIISQPQSSKSINSLISESAQQPFKEGIILIRKINKWHKFFGSLTSNSINLSFSKQSNCILKINFDAYCEVQKKAATGCFSITNKNKEKILECVCNGQAPVNDEHKGFVTFCSGSISSVVLKCKSDYEAEEWIRETMHLISKLQRRSSIDQTDDFIDDFIEEDDQDVFRDDDEISQYEEVKSIPIVTEVKDVLDAAKSVIEKRALEKFIGELNGLYDPVNHDGYMLMRFLRARQLNIPKAITMFTNYINWRKEFKPDMITKDQVMSEIKKKKGYFHYFDRKNQPLLIAMVGKHSQKDSDLHTMLHFLVYIIETAIKHMPANIERFSAIIDCTNLSVNQVDFPLVKDGLNILQNFYPERLGGVYITNYPMLFQVVWKVIKPLLDARTSEKIRFCNPKELLEFFEPRYLPVRFGGTSKFEETDYEIGLETLLPQ